MHVCMQAFSETLIGFNSFWQINIWGYSSRKLLHSIDTGHSANIFCTKFIPETSDELVASGAGDAEVISCSVNSVKEKEKCTRK